MAVDATIVVPVISLIIAAASFAAVLIGLKQKSDSSYVDQLKDRVDNAEDREQALATQLAQCVSNWEAQRQINAAQGSQIIALQSENAVQRSQIIGMLAELAKLPRRVDDPS